MLNYDTFPLLLLLALSWTITFLTLHQQFRNSVQIPRGQHVLLKRSAESPLELLKNNGSKLILVTGGAGFVGSNLVDNLMYEGHSVLVCDNLHTGKRNNLNKWRSDPKLRLIEHDVVKPIPSELIPGKLDQIYHLASPASPIHYMANPIQTIKTNVFGTINMLELAKKSNARLLIASTSEVYGDPEVHPQHEGYWGHVNPVGPRSCYDESKRLSESLATAYQSRENVSVVIARIFNTYGPRMQPNDGRVISNFIVQALHNKSLTVYGDGKQTRSFQYISDLVIGLKKLMNSNPLVQGPVNLGNPEEVTINELANKVTNILYYKPKPLVVHSSLPVDDPHRRRPDIKKANSLLDWEPKVGLDDGLRKTLAHFEVCVSGFQEDRIAEGKLSI